jgi:hypothetical protein
MNSERIIPVMSHDSGSIAIRIQIRIQLGAVIETDGTDTKAAGGESASSLTGGLVDVGFEEVAAEVAAASSSPP